MQLVYSELRFRVGRSSVFAENPTIEATSLADVEFLLIAIIVKPAVHIGAVETAQFGRAVALGGETVLVGKVVVRLSRQPVAGHHGHGCV